VRKDPLCAGPVHSPGDEPRTSEQIPETSTTTWVEAVHVCEVRYREFTPDGLLRHAAFVRLRNDKSAHDCERQGWSDEGRGKRKGRRGKGEAGRGKREAS
jgi:bifunctional non-homologous end joining protein LigD